MAATHVGTFDLTTEAGVEAYLTDTPFACSKADPLAGGLGNFVFRLHLRQSYDGHQTLVLKHSRSYVKAMPHIPFDIRRQVFEVEALRRIGEWIPQTTFITVPRIYHHDEKEHTIIMNDCGSNSISLKEYMRSGRCSLENAHRIGKGVGDFLGKLHSWGRNEADVRQFFGENYEGKVISSWVTYGRVLPTFDGSLEKLRDPDVKLSEGKAHKLEQICEETSDAMKKATNELVMGDFWPGNLALSFDETGDVKQIWVLDWESCKLGVLGVELGQFSAELVLLMRFNADICGETAAIMLEDFFGAYSTFIVPDLEMCRRTIVHLGGHLLTLTPRIEWGGKEITQEVVKEGVKLMIEGYTAEKGWLMSSVIRPLVTQIP